jgi:dynein heavy chain
MTDELEINDSRVEFMAMYIIKSLKIKGDKFTKMYAAEEYKIMIHDFLDKVDQSLLVFSVNPASQALNISYSYPNQLKAKAVYFSKKSKDPVTKDQNIKDALIYGDLSYSPIEQLSAILDEVHLYNFLAFLFQCILFICRIFFFILSSKVIGSCV